MCFGKNIGKIIPRPCTGRSKFDGSPKCCLGFLRSLYSSPEEASKFAPRAGRLQIAVDCLPLRSLRFYGALLLLGEKTAQIPPMPSDFGSRSIAFRYAA